MYDKKLIDKFTYESCGSFIIKNLILKKKKLNKIKNIE
jgi:hypothetical protein